ncbi:MAG TPA: hypothetical protein VIR57_04325 [Chloroflexota bacterium]
MERPICPGTGWPWSRSATRSGKLQEDRTNYQWRHDQALARGDKDDAQFWIDAIAEWEKEQGDTKWVMACGVCGDRFLKRTQQGLARRHKRWHTTDPTWNDVRRLRKQIAVLQVELDKALDFLEPD